MQQVVPADCAFVVHTADPISGARGTFPSVPVSIVQRNKELISVLFCLQQVVPADYAFVVHTADPISGARGTAVGELVVGMGEALVGNMPGRALSFSAAAGNGAGRFRV